MCQEKNMTFIFFIIRFVVFVLFVGKRRVKFFSDTHHDSNVRRALWEEKRREEQEQMFLPGLLDAEDIRQ